MFKNYFRTAFRVFKKNKLTAVINLLGLSIGISAALIVFLVIQYDYSFDKYEPGKDRIYRMVSEGKDWKNQGVPAPMLQAVPGNLTGVEAAAPLIEYDAQNPKISIPQANQQPLRIFKKQEHIVFTDKNYFSIFPHQWLAGNAASALKNPYNLVLSESNAKLYFPDIPTDKLIGKTVIFGDTLQTVVTGIVKDLKANSDFENKSFISLATIPATAGIKLNYNWDEWGNTNSNTQLLVKLLPNVSSAQVNKNIASLVKQRSTDAFVLKTVYRLQPLSDVHFNPEFDGKVDTSVLRNLVLLAIFLLLLGAINFINLSTAQAAQRAKEIGIRKTLGSNKKELLLQFLSETFLLTVLATILSILITPLLLKAFAGFIPEGLQFIYFFNQPIVLGFLLLLVIVVSILAGLYPAFILTRFRPVLVLKNQTYSNLKTTRTAWLRKSLIVFQFVIAQVFIIGMIVVNKQIHYSLQKDMGFRKDAIINFYLPFSFYNQDINKKNLYLRNQLRTIPELQEVSLGNQSPAISGAMSTSISFKEGGKNVDLNVDVRNGDTAYLGVYNIKLIAGRNILPTDSATEVLINETLAKQLGFVHPADAVGHFVSLGDRPVPIAGVMKDFNLRSVRTAIHPLIYYADQRYGYVMHIALQANPAKWKTAIAKVETEWKAVYPNLDFDYRFFDKSISAFYKEDQQLSLLLSWSAGVAIFISCLGLLGLAIFMTNNRTKEIGVRKVLGASVMQITTLLSKDFAKLLMLAIVIALPIAWWQTHNWLQNFAYHTGLSWWVFVVSGLVMIAIALTIVCIKTAKAALVNPVKSLRTE